MNTNTGGVSQDAQILAKAIQKDVDAIDHVLNGMAGMGAMLPPSQMALSRFASACGLVKGKLNTSPPDSDFLPIEEIVFGNRVMKAVDREVAKYAIADPTFRETYKKRVRASKGPVARLAARKRTAVTPASSNTSQLTSGDLRNVRDAIARAVTIYHLVVEAKRAGIDPIVAVTNPLYSDLGPQIAKNEIKRAKQVIGVCQEHARKHGNLAFERAVYAVLMS